MGTLFSAVHTGQCFCCSGTITHLGGHKSLVTLVNTNYFIRLYNTLVTYDFSFNQLWKEWHFCMLTSHQTSKMSQVLPLSFISRLVTIQAILDDREKKNSKSDKWLLGLFRTNNYTTVSQEVFSHLVKYHPNKVTNQLMTALVPPHLRELSLKHCKNITATGLITVLSR